MALEQQLQINFLFEDEHELAWIAYYQLFLYLFSIFYKIETRMDISKGEG